MEYTIPLVQIAYTIIAKANQTIGWSMISRMYLMIVIAIAKIARKVRFLRRTVVKGSVIWTLLPRRLLKNSRIFVASDISS